MSNQTLFIVDPFSSGSYFAPRALDLYDLRSVAIMSSPNMIPGLEGSFHPNDFDAVITHSVLADTVKAVEREAGDGPVFLICGSEPGVPLYDVLTDYWGLEPNDLSKSTARRDKCLMQAALRDAGVPHVPFLASDDPTEIRSWCSGYPGEQFVIKPLSSFGSDGVSFATSAAEAAEKAAAMIGTKSLSGNTNDQVLVEPFLVGPELVVDIVSHGGSHYVTDVFRYTKEARAGAPLYRTMSAEDPTGYAETIRYVKSCLDALGIVSGPSHSEVIFTEAGPRLVETGARMHGGQGPRLVEAAYDVSLIDLALTSRCDPEGYNRMTEVPTRLNKGVVECFLAVERGGRVVSNNMTHLIQQLETYYYDTVTAAPGDLIPRTTDLVSSYGRIVLASEDCGLLEADVARIMDWDRRGEVLVLS